MSARIQIRAAVSDDHPDLCVLFEELDAFHREGAPWLLRSPVTEARPQSYLDGLLSDPRATVLGAHDGASCLGLAIIKLEDAPEFPVFIEQTWAVVDNIAVRTDARRRGIGRALYDACVEWSKERDACWMELTVYEFNESARGFYESLGFQTVRRRMRLPLR